MDSTTVVVVAVLFGLLAIPPLLRWHHIWLIAAWNMSAVLFFVPGRPALWMALAAVSFAICILQSTLNRNMKFLPVPSLARPLLLLAVVVLITARATGGMGLRVMGGDAYGGKRYFAILAAILGYFAIINRRIPPKRAGLYVALYFLSGASMALMDLPGVVSPAFYFVFLLFPGNFEGVLAPTSVAGPVGDSGVMSRIAGLPFLAMGGFCWMLARYSLRGILDGAKPWRLGAFGLFCLAGLLGGYRSVLILFIMVLAILFFLERLHHTRLLLPVILISLTGMGVVGLFSSRLPFPIQRSLAFMPFLTIDPVARMDAQASSDWRMPNVARGLPQVPQYLFIGKGYTFSATEHEQMGKSLEGVELVTDYHNGPLSVILPFGIAGVIAFVWLLVAGLRVLYQNYQFGDPAYHTINTFLFVYFVANVISFCFVFGSLHSDLHNFLGLLALSVSLNGGVAKPAVVPRPKVIFNRFRLHPSAHRPVGA